MLVLPHRIEYIFEIVLLVAGLIVVVVQAIHYFFFFDLQNGKIKKNNENKNKQPWPVDRRHR